MELSPLIAFCGIFGRNIPRASLLNQVLWLQKLILPGRFHFNPIRDDTHYSPQTIKGNGSIMGWRPQEEATAVSCVLIIQGLGHGL
ncbi:MAG TPA: hypothetical protein DCR97_01385 [Deltaproteobacteria bacterium]|nr:hypothetical protein [Deltaproteobacteria bacterium]